MIGDPPRLVIRTRVPRLSAAEVAPFRGRSTSFVVDAMNGRGALHLAIKPLDPQSRLVGSAITARAGARDNLAALAALDLIEPGDVLVISTQGFEGTATLGDNMTRIAQIRGAAGVVTDGMARDSAEIIALGMPVFCRGVTPNSAFPSGPGEVGLPLALGEVTIESGDLIIGDRDGVVVVPRAQLAAVTARLDLVAAKEAEMHARWPRARSARCSTATQSCVSRSRTWTEPRRMGAATVAQAPWLCPVIRPPPPGTPPILTVAVFELSSGRADTNVFAGIAAPTSLD